MHWIDANWEYREYVLAVWELVGKHDNKSMASILLEIIEKFKLQVKVSISWIGIIAVMYWNFSLLLCFLISDLLYPEISFFFLINFFLNSKKS